MKKTINIIILLFFFLTCIYISVSVFKIITTNAPDFVVLYKSTEDLIHGINPYTDKKLPDAYLYPSITAFFYFPLTFFSYQFAQGVFVILSAFAVPVIVYITLKTTGEKFSWRHVVIFISLSYLAFPVKFTLGMGQSNLLATLFLITGYYLFYEKEWSKSGIFLTCAYFLKPIFAFTVFFFLFVKAWKTLRSLTLTVLILLFISSVSFGLLLHKFYILTLIPSLLNGVGNAVYYNQSIVGFLMRTGLDITLIKIFALLFTFTLFCYVLLLLIKRKIDKTILFALFVTIIPLIHTLSWQHHFAILIIPFIIATMKILKNKKYLLFSILLFAYILVGWNIKHPEQLFGFFGNILLSHNFFGALILFTLLVKINSIRFSK